MKNILIIGAGGIGSYVSNEIYNLILNDQIDIDKVDITIADDDIVELKNIKYQNFEKTDITKEKAEVIGTRYDFNCVVKRIEKDKELDPYNIFMICVDNPKARLLIYQHCMKHKDKHFIDGRSEGKSFAMFTKNDKTLEELKKSLGKDEGSTSCQLKYRLENNIVDLGNKIIAPIMVQALLNYLRGESSPCDFRGTI